MSYSRFVRWLKIGLPLVALALLSSIFLIPRERGFDLETLYSTADLVKLGEGMTVSNPRFTGMTEAGEPFEVTAEAATPDGPDPEQVALTAPRARIDQADRSVALHAAGGELFPKTGEVALSGGVRIETSDGYVVTTEAARANVRGGTVQAPGAVEAVGPRGSITAGSFRAERGGDAAMEGVAKNGKIWFENRVRVTYDPRALPAAEPEGEDAGDRGASATDEGGE